MKRTPVWIVTVPTPTDDTPARDGLGRVNDADVLHVLSDPEVTTVLTRTRHAAEQLTAPGGDTGSGPARTEIRPGFLWEIGRDGNGDLDLDDTSELDAMGSKMDLTFVNDTAAYSELHHGADPAGTHG